MGRCILQSLSPSIEDISFMDCYLDDEKAKVFSEVKDRYAALKKVDFGGNRSLSAVGWRCILQSLSPSIEDFSFNSCDLDDEKAKVFSEAKDRYAALKKVDFRENRSLRADGWRCILRSLSPSIEDISFNSCNLDDEKAKVFSEVKDRYAVLKKVDFGDNTYLSADGWRCILPSLSPSIEDFSF